MTDDTFSSPTDDQLQERVANLAEWLHRIRRERRRAIFKRALSLIVICAVVTRVLGSNTGFLPFVFVFAGGGGALLGLGTLNPLREAAREVIALDDIRTIVVLLQAMHAPDSMTVGQTENRVSQLLPQLRSEDRSWLTTASVREIIKLTDSRSPIMALSALRALEFVGDAYSLTAVAHIADLTNDLPEGQMQSEARRILPILKARVETEAKAAKLLRPAETTEGQDLLRPATTVGEDAPDRLLHTVDDVPTVEDLQRAKGA